MVKSVENLLEKFKQNAIEKFEKLKEDKEYPTPVNCPVSLFGTIESGCKETAYTRALAYLLDHNETHGFGKDIFVAFCNKIKTCKKIPFQAESADYDVNAELWNQDKNNRYDIHISGKQTKGTANPYFLIVVEAKINASFGKDQLKRYDKDLESKPENLIKICLTKEKLDEKNLTKEWISLTWKDIAALLWEAIKGKKDKAGYEYVRYYISSIYQDIYRNNIKYSDIYNFIDDESYDQSLIGKLQECEIDLKTLIKYPNTCTAVYWQTKEGCAFDASYLLVCQKLADVESAILKDFSEKKDRKFSSTSLNDLWKSHWHKEEKFEMEIGLSGKMDQDYNEKMVLSLDAYTHSKANFPALKRVFEKENLPPNKPWWDKGLLLFEEPVHTPEYFFKKPECFSEKINELKEKLGCFYKKIKKDFK